MNMVGSSFILHPFRGSWNYGCKRGSVGAHARDTVRGGHVDEAVGEVPMDRLPQEVEVKQRLREVPRHGLARLFLEDEHVAGLYQQALARVPQGAFEVHADGHVT